MRHRIKGKILGLKKNKRKALIKSLIRSLLHFKRIKTTKAKAKEVKKVFDRLMAKSQHQSLATIRYLRKTLNKEDVFKIITLAKKYNNNNNNNKIGGYTRILNLKPRIKDGAKMALLEIINFAQEDKKTEEKKANQNQSEEKPKEITQNIIKNNIK